MRLNLQRGVNTKSNKIGVLSLAFFMLVVFGTGNALAYSWTGTDSSTITSGYSVANWNSYVSGHPQGTRGSALTWGNIMQVNGATSLYPTIGIENENAQQVSTIQCTYPLHNGQTWPSSGTVQGSYTVPQGSTGGDHCMYCWHWYGTSQGDERYCADGPSGINQAYYV